MQLLNWQKRRTTAPDPYRVYRIAPHSPSAPLFLLPKTVSLPQYPLLDPRGAFLVQTPKCMYVWQVRYPIPGGLRGVRVHKGSLNHLKHFLCRFSATLCTVHFPLKYARPLPGDNESQLTARMCLGAKMSCCVRRCGIASGRRVRQVRERAVSPRHRSGRQGSRRAAFSARDVVSRGAQQPASGRMCHVFQRLPGKGLQRSRVIA